MAIHLLKYAQYEINIREKDMCVEVLSFNFFYILWYGLLYVYRKDSTVVSNF